MINEAIRWMLEDLTAARVEFEHCTGPRNDPARRWLASRLGRPLSKDSGRDAVPAADFSAVPADLPVEINREPPDAT